MLTRSAIFEEFAERYGVQVDTIVKVTIGSNEYLFSHRPMPQGLNSRPIYPILISCSDITESVDIFGKSFQVGDMSVSLSDLSFYPVSGERPTTASDLLADINGASLDIYLIAGNLIDDLNECLHVFAGIVLNPPTIRNHQFSFSASDSGKLNDMVLPDKRVLNEYPDAPAELKLNYIPIAYGDFDIDDLLAFTGHGLAKGIPFEDKILSKYLLASHEVYEVYRTYFNLGGPTVIRIDADIPSTSPSGYPEASANPNYNGVCKLKFLLTETLQGTYDDEVYQADNPEYACDDNEVSQADLKDNKLDTTQDMEGLGLWGFIYNDLFIKHLQAGGYIIPYYIRLSEGSGVSITEIEAFLYYGREDNADQRIQIGYTSNFDIHWGSSTPYAFDDPVSGEKVTSGDITTERFGQVLVIAFRAESGNQYDGDGTTDNQTMVKIGEFYLWLFHNPTDRPAEMWWAGTGRKYGTWIENRDLTPTSYFSDYSGIVHASGIIESLFREYLGLTDADIDIESFNSMLLYEYANTLESRINIINQTAISDIARQIAEQSVFCVCYSGAGKLRIVSLVESDPTIRATIQREDIIDDRIEIEKSSRIINDLVINSRWQEQYGAFYETNTYTDSVSDSKHRTRSATYNWQNIDGSTAAFIAQKYVNATNGMWSKEHIQAALKTHGFKYAHLEAGDWVRLSVDCDDIKKPFGGSWEWKNLLVTEVSKNEDSIDFELTEIDETTDVAPSPSPEVSPEVSPSPEPSPSPGAMDALWLINDSNPSTSTLLTGYSEMLDDILAVWVLKPWSFNYSVGIDMGDATEISKLRLYDDGAWGAGLQSCTVYLYTSNDNATWTYRESFTTPTLTRVATGGTNDPYYIDFEFSVNRTARYFKLYAFSGPLKATSGYSLLWSEILATEISPSPSPSPSP